jgi:hypothetical protein
MDGMHYNEGGHMENEGRPQYADLSNAQVMDQLQQQNPNNLQQYQDDQEGEGEEEGKSFMLSHLLCSREAMVVGVSLD